MSSSDQNSLEPVTRRLLLRGGLAGLASTIAYGHLVGCSSPESEEASRREEDTVTLPPLLQDQMRDQGVTDQNVEADEDLGGLMSADEGSSADLDQGSDLENDLGEGMLDQGVQADFPQRDLPSSLQLISMISTVGPLLSADEYGLRLPEGFSARIIARSGQEVLGGGHRWHLAPDGGATYPTEDGGWIYVSNSEISILGGVSAIRFDARGEIIDAYPILDRTNKNCAGGVTPWHTWLSCEEIGRGRVFECSPWGDQEAILRLALGVFKHEAVAVDSTNGHLYLTEDESDGGFYRFTASQENVYGFPDLNAGDLEIATVSATGQVSWTLLPDPQYTGETPTRYQVPHLTPFNGGEGIWFHDGVVYFSTKGDNKVWAYNTQSAQLDTIYDGRSSLTGVDNLTVSCCGDVLVAEDGGSMQIVVILPNGELKTLVQIEGQDESEVTGPAFDPSGTRLYFSSQRGPSGQSIDGITYEVTGPFHRLA